MRILFVMLLGAVHYFTCFGMEPSTHELKPVEAVVSKKLEASPEPKRTLAQEIVAHRELVNATNEHFVYLNAQLLITNTNIIGINDKLVAVREAESNVIKIDKNIKYLAAGMIACLCCCVIIPVWIALGYSVAR